MVTVRVWPWIPAFGDTDTKLAEGTTVKLAVFPLWNAAPPLVVPEIDTAYAVADETVVPAGMTNVIRRVLPTTVRTPVAAVLTALPPPAGVSVIVTLLGGIVPLGKPEPARFTLVRPACPELGLVGLTSFTLDVCAARGNAADKMTPRIERTFRLGVILFAPHRC